MKKDGTTEEQRQQRQWRTLTWAPICAATVATALLLLAGGPEWVRRVGVPAESGWWVPLGAFSVFTHLSAAHLLGGIIGWWCVCEGWREQHNTAAHTVAYIATTGFVTGAITWAAFGDGRALHGSSAAVIATAAALVVCGSGKWRNIFIALVALMLLPNAHTATVAHITGVICGAGAGALIRTNRRREQHTQ